MDLETRPLQTYDARMLSAILLTAAMTIIHDDYPRARTEALRQHVPVFVEVWAPW